MESQHQIVLDHLKKHGSISALEAEREYGITRLIHRIIYLRNQGYDITEETRTRENRWGEDCRYKAYVLSLGEEGRNNENP
jgi:hypothetical protein